MGFLSSLGRIAGTIIGGPKAGEAIGGLLEGDSAKDHAMDMAAADANLQREFAQNGIRWRVEDAKAAGIHPLYALGAQTAAASPVFAGTVPPAASMSDYGQDLSRSIYTTMTSGERSGSRALGELQLERAGLENELLRSQIAGAKMALLRQAGPPMPGGTIVNPSEVITGSVDAPERQPGVITEHQFTAGNLPTVVPSKEMKERIEDDFISETMWNLQNRLIAPRHPDPDLYWNPFVQRYVKKPWKLRYN